jgi:hypothetical protein
MNISLTLQVESWEAAVHAAQLIFDAQQETVGRMQHLPVLQQVTLVPLHSAHSIDGGWGEGGAHSALTRWMGGGGGNFHNSFRSR